jgi:hypothetical protein
MAALCERKQRFAVRGGDSDGRSALTDASQARTRWRQL